jgi:hypothetical protein
MLADFVVKHKKQVVKLFAVVKWARDAGDVQKCMVRPCRFHAGRMAMFIHNRLCRTLLHF